MLEVDFIVREIQGRFWEQPLRQMKYEVGLLDGLSKQGFGLSGGVTSYLVVYIFFGLGELREATRVFLEIVDNEGVSLKAQKKF
jgi:hypothetical protein